MIQDALIQTIHTAARAAAPALGLDPNAVPRPELSRPRLKEHGDWATNVALVLAPGARKPPRQVAEAIAAGLPIGDIITRVEVAGPGFINLFLGAGWLHDVLRTILAQGDRFGFGDPREERVQVEFVSANPTGPLHVGTARNAAIGDSLSNVLAAAGYDVQREYYFNDAGRQLDLFAASVEARYLQRFGLEREVPEGGYHGEYIGELAGAIAAEQGDTFVAMDETDRRAALLNLATGLVMEEIRITLRRFNVRIDTWFSEADLRESGAVDRVVDRLTQAGDAYRAEGAVFFRSTTFGDEKDRVLIRSNGEPTYFAADCAYVLDKASRGFDRLIYVWGADHHGTVKRLEAAAQALGVKASVEILLYQLVAFYRGGQPVRMSKRTGELISLDELLDEVGTDAARFTLLSRSADSAMDFDIELVTRQTMDNPVYYVQYGHARIASILRKAAAEWVSVASGESANLARLEHEAELDLLRVLSELPDVIEGAATALAPNRLTRYAEQVASSFHHFYTECRVITDDAELTLARLALVTSTKQVIASALGLLGVSAPESMERIDGDAD